MTRPEAPIDMTPARVMCDRHGEPFRARWPRGYAVFSLGLFQAIAADPVFAAAAQAHPEGRERGIEALLDESPLCCRATDAQLLRAYVASRAGRSRKCKNCREVRLGAPYKRTIRAGQVVETPHLCFVCVIHRMEPIQ